MKILKDLINRLRYGTTDEDEIKCIKEGHDCKTVVFVSVPEQEYERMKRSGEPLREKTEDGATLVYECGEPLLDYAQIWVPQEVVEKRCTRCGKIIEIKGL